MVKHRQRYNDSFNEIVGYRPSSMPHRSPPRASLAVGRAAFPCKLWTGEAATGGGGGHGAVRRGRRVGEKKIETSAFACSAQGKSSPGSEAPIAAGRLTLGEIDCDVAPLHF